MKFMILFALAGLGVCYNYDGYEPQPPVEYPPFKGCEKPYSNPYPEDKRCLEYVYKNILEFRTAIENLFCKYIKDEVERKEEFYQTTKQELIEIAECAGCHILKIFGIQGGEEIGSAIGNTVGDQSIFIGRTLEFLGLSKPLASLVCVLLIRPLQILEKIAPAEDVGKSLTNVEKVLSG